MARLAWQVLPQYLLRSDLVTVLGLVVLLVYGQYYRVAVLERRLYGVVLHPPGAELLHAFGYGAVGGLVATAAFLAVGVSLSEAGIAYVWMLALLLALFHPRFLCFSYGGGLISLASLLLGYPRVDVAAVAALVAILHLVEAVLIYLDGYRNATPLFVRLPGGRVVGGYTLQKFWPIPFVALVSAAIAADALRSEWTHRLGMPDWWPLIRPAEPGAGLTLVWGLFPAVAALGYSDVAVTRLPVQKARRTAGVLTLYSLALLGLAVLARHGFLWQLAAALFSPLAHELVIYLGRRAEERGEPLFRSEGGAMVLDVLPGSPAQAMGLRPGDLVTAANGWPVRGPEDLRSAMEPWALSLELVVRNVVDGQERVVRYDRKVPPLGAILAPSPGQGLGAVLDMGSRRTGQLPAAWRRLRERWAHRGDR